MHIGIFSERFISRYGADRVNIILAELLQKRGHQVTLVGVRFSDQVLERFDGHTIPIPQFPKGSEELTLNYLKDTNYYRDRHLPKFDVCLVGSFPFILSIPYLKKISRKVIFIDYGVVPTTGYSKQAIQLIQEVIKNRQHVLRECDHIIAISDFIAQTQSKPDCFEKVLVITTLLGANHLSHSFGLIGIQEQKSIHLSQQDNSLKLVRGLEQEGRRLVLLLGRWEPGCYKNSQVALEIIRELRDLEPQSALLVLAHPTSFTPPDLKDYVFPIGTPTDAELAEIMNRVEAGISVSLWEGFNLPLAEMQYQGKQVLAFSLAAHPEVVVTDEQLCSSAEEMTSKLFQILKNNSEDSRFSQCLPAWKRKFSWERFSSDFVPIVEEAA